MAVPEPITRLEKYWAAILDKIQGGGSAPVLESLKVYDNGEYTPDEGVDGFDYANVQVPDPVVETLNVSANGTYTPDEGVDGWYEVVVSVPQSSSVLESLTATENGTYYPGEGYDGFDQVVVGVEREWNAVTFTGTLDAPFTFADLIEMADADKIFGSMTIDGTAIGAGNAQASLDYIDWSLGTLHYSVVEIPSSTVSDVTAAMAIIEIDTVNQDISLTSAKMMQQGAIVDVSQYASLMPTTTTFVYHTPSSND